MKKITLLLAVFIMFGTVNVHAAESPFVFSVSDSSYHQQVPVQMAVTMGMPYRLYVIDSKNLTAKYVGLDKAEQKSFLKSASDETKKVYKNIQKAQKYIQKNKWVKAEEKMPNFIPIKLQYFDYVLKQGDISGALRTLLEIKNLNAATPVIDSMDINYNLGVLFFATGQYGQALAYLKPFENTGDEGAVRSISECYYNLKSYQLAIDALKKVKTLTYADNELFFLSYYKLNNKSEANKYALLLVKESPSLTNYMRVVNTTSNQGTKLEYLYKARSAAQLDEEIVKANKDIATIEQKKLEKRVSAVSSGQFVKVPSWNEVLNQLPQGVVAIELSSEQDKFFKNANDYVSKYRGQQLTNAFNSLGQDCNNFVQNKKNEFYQRQQLEAQNALVIEQQRQNQLQQQMIYEQRRQNAIQHQQLYYMRHRYLYY